MEKEILEIAKLVEQLRIEDSELRVFGADSHKYRIGPKLSEEEISNFELEQGIVLPPDYRLWLQLVGNGSGLKGDGLNGRWRIAGLGPDYGIYNLQDTVFVTCPRQPFKPVPVESAQFAPDSIEEVFEIENEDEIPGVLEMGTPGCAGTTYLIVNGQGSGTIWSSWEGEIWPTGLTFSQWVRKWVENVLPCVINERVADSLKEGMTKAQIIEICGNDFEEITLFGMRRLRFKNFVTQFELDENECVSQVIRHSNIYN